MQLYAWHRKVGLYQRVSPSELANTRWNFETAVSQCETVSSLHDRWAANKIEKFEYRCCGLFAGLLLDYHWITETHVSTITVIMIACGRKFRSRISRSSWNRHSGAIGSRFLSVFLFLFFLSLSIAISTFSSLFSAHLDRISRIPHVR